MCFARRVVAGRDQTPCYACRAEDGTLSDAGSIPATSTKNQKGHPKGWPFWFKRPSSDSESICASPSRASPERCRPANSFASGNSAERPFPGPLRFSSGEGIFIPDQPELGLLQYADDEGIARADASRQFPSAIHRRI